MVINSKVELRFETKLQVLRWNKKHHSAFQVGDIVIVDFKELATLKKHRMRKLKVKCDLCGKIMEKSICRIKEVDGKHFCCSCIQKGDRGYWRTHIRTKKYCQYMSKLFSGRNNPFYGKHHTDEAKEKLRIANLGNKNHLGKRHSCKTKEIISKAVLQTYRNGTRKTPVYSNKNKGYYKGLLYESSFELAFLKYFEQKRCLKKIVRGPTIQYLAPDGKIRNYLSDFYFKDYDLVIEIKSSRYWNLELNINLCKKKAAKKLYNYIVIIDNKFSNFERLLKKLSKTKSKSIV